MSVDQPTRALGRPTRYSPAMARRICEAIASGSSLRTICLREEMPCLSTVLLWVTQKPDFSEQYDRAREARADMLVEDMLHIADTPQEGTVTKETEKGTFVTTGDMIEHRRLQVDARKWNAARMAPKKYGDKSETTHKGDPMAPVALILNGSDVHG